MTAEVEFNAWSPGFLADPFPHYARMRERCPVFHHQGAPAEYYIAFSHKDVRAIQMDPATWTVRHGSSLLFRDPNPLFSDGEDHLAMRRIFMPRLQPVALAKFEPQIRAIVGELLDAMMAKGSPAEIHDDFAVPLPVRVISILIGVGDTGYGELKQRSDLLMETGFRAEREAYLAHYRELCAFFDRYIDERYAMLERAGVREPAKEHVGSVLPDDFLSDFVCATYLGRRVTRGEMHFMLMAILAGGNETTTYLITNIIWRLLEDRARWEAVRAEPARLIPIAIEETLRHDSPQPGLFRTSACPVSLHGENIPAGKKMQVTYASANRDETVFSDPEAFRLDREPMELQKHMAFGVGAHNCPGQHLSRLETWIALGQFLERLPNLTLAGKTERIALEAFWGRAKLPVAW